MNNLPIGIFDSGLGGLTLVKEVRKIIPRESILYLGDTARVPYGPRSKETVVKFALEDLDFLEGKGVKCIAIACNTVSALAVKEVRKKTKLKVFDVITCGAYDAVKVTKNKKIGIIGTRGTINSNAYPREIKKLDPKIDVFQVAAPLLVPFIEEGEISGPRIESLLDEYLNPLKSEKIDTLILGCTHYPLLINIIKSRQKEMNLINPSVRLASKLKDFISTNGLGNTNKTGMISFYVTDLNPRFVQTAEMFLGQTISGNIKKTIID